MTHIPYFVCVCVMFSLKDEWHLKDMIMKDILLSLIAKIVYLVKKKKNKKQATIRILFLDAMAQFIRAA